MKIIFFGGQRECCILHFDFRCFFNVFFSCVVSIEGPFMSFDQEEISEEIMWFGWFVVSKSSGIMKHRWFRNPHCSLIDATCEVWRYMACLGFGHILSNELKGIVENVVYHIVYTYIFHGGIAGTFEHARCLMFFLGVGSHRVALSSTLLCILLKSQFSGGLRGFVQRS